MTPLELYIRVIFDSLRCWWVFRLREALLREQGRFGVAAMNGLKVTALGRLSKQLKTLRAVPARPCSLAACSRKNARKAACKSLHLIQKNRWKWEMLRWERELVWLSAVLV